MFNFFVILSVQMRISHFRALWRKICGSSSVGRALASQAKVSPKSLDKKLLGLFYANIAILGWGFGDEMSGKTRSRVRNRQRGARGYEFKITFRG